MITILLPHLNSINEKLIYQNQLHKERVFRIKPINEPIVVLKRNKLPRNRSQHQIPTYHSHQTEQKKSMTRSHSRLQRDVLPQKITANTQLRETQSSRRILRPNKGIITVKQVSKSPKLMEHKKLLDANQSSKLDDYLNTMKSSSIDSRQSKPSAPEQGRFASSLSNFNHETMNVSTILIQEKIKLAKQKYFIDQFAPKLNQKREVPNRYAQNKLRAQTTMKIRTIKPTKDQIRKSN